MEFIIIDDSLFDLFTQEKLLLKSGLATHVRAFGTAMEALEFLQEQTASMPETVILLDLQMPGLNGFEFTERFATLPEDLRERMRLFMISSTVDARDIARAASNPYIVKLLSKPLEIPLFKQLLAQ